VKLHKECNQEIVKEPLCPNCKKPLRVKDLVTCPSCGEVFEPQSVDAFCTKCNALVDRDKVKEVKWCPKCNRKVLSKEVKQAFPVDKDKLMEITRKEKEEWENLLPEEGNIEIRYPIHREGISPIYFDTIYGLIPNIDKAKEEKELHLIKFLYALFREILEDGKLAFVVDLFIKKKYHRALIMYERRILVLITLIEQDRITWPEIPGPEIDLPFDQLGIAKEGVRRIAYGRVFQPEEDARDPSLQYFQTLVERKIRKKKVVYKPPVRVSPEEIEEVTKEIESTLIEGQKKNEKRGKGKKKNC